jgi:hypothetical protein
MLPKISPNPSLPKRGIPPFCNGKGAQTIVEKVGREVEFFDYVAIESLELFGVWNLGFRYLALLRSPVLGQKFQNEGGYLFRFL